MDIIKATNYYKGVAIKGCPFCGEDDQIYFEQYEHAAGPRWRIVCACCMARIDPGYIQQPTSYLIDLWNTRYN